MALPPQMTQEELEQLMNVANPLASSVAFVPPASVLAPDMPLGDILGSDITYFKRPENISYSMENLPLWMQDFKQVSPTTYAPDQGVFNAAPIIESIQATMPQDYIEQYQPLEQAYQESLGIDPTWFGGEYRSGIYMPTQTMPERTDEGSFDIVGALAASEALRKLYPYAEDAAKAVYDPVEEFVQQNVLEPTEEAIQQKVLDPTEDAFKVVADPIEEGVQQVILDPIEDIVKIPLKAADEVLGVTDKLESVKETIIDPLVEKIKINKEEKPDGQDSIFDGVKNAAEVAAKAVAETDNMIKNPLGQNSEDAVNAINELGDLAGVGGEDGRVIPPAVAEGLVVAGNLAAVSKAFEDPSAANLANGYAAVDDLTMNYTEAGGLPAGQSIGEIGSILTGLEALDGGIESPAEAVSVINGANAAAGLAGSTTTSLSGETVKGFLPAGLGTFFTAAALVKPITSALKGGSAGVYARIQGNFELKDGKFAVGDNVQAADTYRSVGDTFARETMNSGVSMANSLVDDYGFEIDEQALKDAPPNIMGLQTSQYYLDRHAKGSSVGSSDFVIKLLQNGVLRPTENTPPEILTSNEAFASFVTDHIAAGRDEYAAKMYDVTEGEGTEMIKMSGGRGSYRREIVVSKASFATQEAAQKWSNDNFKENYSMKKTRVGRRMKTLPHKTTTSYEIVPTKVGDQTVYELKKSSNAVKVSQAEYDAAKAAEAKVAAEAKAKAASEASTDGLDLDFLKGLDFSGFTIGTLF